MAKLNIRKLKLQFLDAGGQQIHHCPLLALPVREERLIACSIAFFDDPAPCMIHRSAVMHRLYTELLDCLEQHLAQGHGRIGWQDLPEQVRCWIDLPGLDHVHELVVMQ